MFFKGQSETLIKRMTSKKHLFKSDKTTITNSRLKNGNFDINFDDSQFLLSLCQI